MCQPTLCQLALTGVGGVMEGLFLISCGQSTPGNTHRSAPAQ